MLIYFFFFFFFKDNKVDFNWSFIFKICVDIAHGMRFFSFSFISFFFFLTQYFRFLHGFVPPIIHRDLKSPNILMCSKGDSSVPVVAKVADFGLSSIAAATIQVNFYAFKYIFFFFFWNFCFLFSLSPKIK